MDLTQNLPTRHTTLSFQAFDYTSEDKFIESTYKFQGSQQKGWQIYRNSHPYLIQGSGYKLLKTKTCGICSTDLDRRFLPFALPQVIGHQLVAEIVTDITRNQSNLNKHDRYVIQINDSYESRGDLQKDSFCSLGLSTHSPERRTLGIDRLLGGFGPYILAPKNSIISCDFLTDEVAALTEPFARRLESCPWAKKISELNNSRFKMLS